MGATTTPGAACAVPAETTGSPSTAAHTSAPAHPRRPTTKDCRGWTLVPMSDFASVVGEMPVWPTGTPRPHRVPGTPVVVGCIQGCGGYTNRLPVCRRLG